MDLEKVPSGHCNSPTGESDSSKALCAMHLLLTELPPELCLATSLVSSYR